MNAVTKNGSKNCASTGPNVCLMQPPGAPSPVPQPIPTTGDCGTLKGESKKVTVENKGAGRKDSEIPKEQMHPPGLHNSPHKGVVSHKCMDKIQWTKGSSKVKVEGKAWVPQSTPTKHNSMNMAGVQGSPCQTKVTLMP